jgi:hypothetical protein
MVVFPVPGGPYRMMDVSWLLSIMHRNSDPGLSNSVWPMISSIVVGRIRIGKRSMHVLLS